MFLDIEFPRHIGRNSSITTVFDTYIEENGFFERRNIRYSFSRLYADLSFSLRKKEEILAIKNLHEKARGSGKSFKFHDFTYHSTNGMTGKAGPADFIIADTKDQLLTKNRLEDNNGKIIQLPKSGTFFMSYLWRGTTFSINTDMEDTQENRDYIDNKIKEKFGSSFNTNIAFHNTEDIFEGNRGYFTDYFKDRISNITLASDDVSIFMGFEFWIKVRFESDEFSVVANGYDSYEAPNCRLVEVFE